MARFPGLGWLQDAGALAGSGCSYLGGALVAYGLVFDSGALGFMGCYADVTR